MARTRKLNKEEPKVGKAKNKKLTAPKNKNQQSKRKQSTRAKNMDSLNLQDLPTELLNEIFKYLRIKDLKAMSQVSKKFYQLSRNRRFILSTKINLDEMWNIHKFNTDIWRYPEIHIRATNIQKLKKFSALYGYLIKTLDMETKTKINLSELLIILKQMPNLSNFRLNNDIVMDLKSLTDLPNIKSYTANCKVEYNNLKFHEAIWKNVDEHLMIHIDPEIFKINKLNENLKSLHLILKNEKKKTFFTQIISKCQKLEKLSIDSYHRKLIISNDILNSGFGDNLRVLKLKNLFITGNDFLKMIKLFKNITKLTLNNCENIKDSDIICALHKLPNLQNLSIISMLYLSNPLLIEGIAADINLNMKKLKLIPTGFNYEISDSRNIPFDVVDITENSIIRCSNNLPNLEKLEILNCSEVITINSFNSIFKNLNNLRKLMIHGGSYNISDVKKEPFINNLKNLEHLEICDMNIPNNLLFDFKFPKLKHLDLQACRLIETSGLEAIAVNCPSLEFLYVTECDSVDSKKLVDLLSNKVFKFLRYCEYSE